MAVGQNDGATICPLAFKIIGRQVTGCVDAIICEFWVRLLCIQALPAQIDVFVEAGRICRAILISVAANGSVSLGVCTFETDNFAVVVTGAALRSIVRSSSGGAAGFNRLGVS